MFVVFCCASVPADKSHTLLCRLWNSLHTHTHTPLSSGPVPFSLVLCVYTHLGLWFNFSPRTPEETLHKVEVKEQNKDKCTKKRPKVWLKSQDFLSCCCLFSSRYCRYLFGFYIFAALLRFKNYWKLTAHLRTVPRASYRQSRKQISSRNQGLMFGCILPYAWHCHRIFGHKQTLFPVRLF